MPGRLFAPVALAIALSILAPAARAATITEFTGGGVTAVATSFYGQSATTPGGGPWTNITFNFYTFASHSSYAIGNLYLLDQEYLGTAQNLSAATSGYIANVAASGGTSWVFAPGVTLQPNATYYFYMDTAAGSDLLAGSGGYAGGKLYTASGSSNYSSLLPYDMAFTLSGTPAPGPIPGAGLLSYLVVGFGGAAAFRKKLRARAASLLAVVKLRWAERALPKSLGLGKKQAQRAAA